MHGLTDYITACAWVDIFTTWYVLVDEAYDTLVARTGRLRQRGPAPEFGDSAVITIALITETFFHGKEELCLAFIRQYHLDLFPRLRDDTRFNRRRRALPGVIEALRQMYTTWLIDPDDPVRVVDSAPIPVCTSMRSGQWTTCAGAEYCGVMVSRRAKLFGFRLHLTTTTNHVIDQWMLTPASHHDGKVVPAVMEATQNVWLLGDNAFHNPRSADWLQRQRTSVLLAMQRRDARQPWPADLRTHVNNVRRTIQRALSVLCTVCHVEQPGSRSLAGLLTRISTRLFAYTVSFVTWAMLPTI